MAKLPSVVTRRLWKLPVRCDPKKAYTAIRESDVVRVLEQGSKVLGEITVKSADNARLLIEGGWLIEQTYPAEAARWQREVEEAAERTRQVRQARGLAARNPQFKAFVQSVEAELGTPRKTVACDVQMRSFPAPRAARLATLIEEARASGAAATHFLAPWGRELVVVAGRVSRLGALFGWNSYGGGQFEAALTALDDDAGLTFDHFGNYLQFGCHLDRAPKRVTKYIDGLVHGFNVGRSNLVTALHARYLNVGDSPSTWRRRWRAGDPPLARIAD